MFKKIKGFENYSINEDGVVRNDITGRILKARLNHRGYVDIALSNKGVSKTFLLHRLVAMTFLDMSEELQVNHIDKDRSNNRLNNLECITQEQNLIHARASKKGNISKLKILSLFKSREWKDCNEFMLEILKY